MRDLRLADSYKQHERLGEGFRLPLLLAQGGEGPRGRHRPGIRKSLPSRREPGRLATV